MADYTLTVRPGHPDFLDLDWAEPLAEWDTERVLDLPKGISRHEVRFVAYEHAIYAVKELPRAPARQDYSVLRALEESAAPAVLPVGLVENRYPDPTAERAAALITLYVDFSFSYRELLEGPGFGRRRNQMLAAFANLLVQLHLAGCFWGDCSLSNVLYRFDAAGIQTLMVDAETAEIHDELTTGRRQEDLEIMKINVAGGMADIAASLGQDIDEADLALGEAIEDRYQRLWEQVSKEVIIPSSERWRINERIDELNRLGFHVEEIDLEAVDGGERLKIETAIGGRRYHADRLRELTGIDVAEGQATQILTDLYRHTARHDTSAAGKAVAAVQWRVDVYEPMLDRMRELNPSGDPTQGYCDFLHYRYLLSRDAGHDVADEEAFGQWVAAGRPGYPLDVPDFTIEVKEGPSARGLTPR